jgi:hypothetical protein
MAVGQILSEVLVFSLPLLIPPLLFDRPDFHHNPRSQLRFHLSCNIIADSDAETVYF